MTTTPHVTTLPAGRRLDCVLWEVVMGTRALIRTDEHHYPDQKVFLEYNQTRAQQVNSAVPYTQVSYFDWNLLSREVLPNTLLPRIPHGSWRSPTDEELLQYPSLPHFSTNLQDSHALRLYVIGERRAIYTVSNTPPDESKKVRYACQILLALLPSRLVELRREAETEALAVARATLDLILTYNLEKVSALDGQRLTFERMTNEERRRELREAITSWEEAAGVR